MASVGAVRCFATASVHLGALARSPAPEPTTPTRSTNAPCGRKIRSDRASNHARRRGSRMQALESSALVGESRGGSLDATASVLLSLEKYLGRAVEFVAALLIAAEIVILFAGVVSRYFLHRPLVWSDELASLLFLWLASLGARDGIPARSIQPRSDLDQRHTRLPAADRRAGLGFRQRRNLRHNAGTRAIKWLASRRAARRPRPDGRGGHWSIRR
jgi:hypothetical protein